MNYKPFIQEIGKVNNPLNDTINVLESKYPNMPLLNLGFHNYTNQVRDKMNDEQLKQRVFHLVVNKFEHKINDYDKDLTFLTKKYFNQEVVSRSFYKLWEMIIVFDLIHLNNSFVSVHLAENNGSFLQATSFFRDKFSKKGNNKYCIVSNDINECVSNIDKSKIFKSNKEIEESNLEIKMNETNADLVTANGTIKFFNSHNKEMQMYNLIINEIISAISVQKKNGNFVLKIYDTFTTITLKLICLLRSLYEKVYIYKPLMSRIFEEERYLVCKNFNITDKTKALSKLKNLKIDIDNIFNKKNHIFDIFLDYKFDNEFKKDIIKINSKIVNNQHLEINKIIAYKKSGNYFGDQYHNYRDLQIEATNWWASVFFLKMDELEKRQKELKSMIKE